MGKNPNKINIVRNNNAYLFDKVGDRYEFYYDSNKDVYYVIDKELNIRIDLEVKVRKYKNFKNNDELKEIRFWFPKPHNFDRDQYKKPIYQIKFELFGIFESKSGSQLKLNLDDCKKIIQNKYEELGYLMGYTDMQQSKDPLMKKAYSVIGNNGGAAKF